MKLGQKEQRVAGPGFYSRVYDIVRQVPSGRVSTYGQVATLLGSPRAARQVGFALSALPLHGGTKPVPWHRIINGRGRVSIRGDVVRGCDQQQLLEAEGVVFDASGKTDLSVFGWDALDVRIPRG